MCNPKMPINAYPTERPLAIEESEGTNWTTPFAFCAGSLLEKSLETFQIGMDYVMHGDFHVRLGSY